MRTATCHPDRAYEARGLCATCYNTDYSRRRYGADPIARTKNLAASRKWRLANVAKMAAAQRAWRLANPDKATRLTVAWRLANPAKIRAQHTAWREKNPGRRAFVARRRRNRRRGAPGTHTRAQWLEKCDSFGNACFYCRREAKLTEDHMVPLSRGGSDAIDNIVPACGRCNSRKKDRTVDEYLAFLQRVG